MATNATGRLSRGAPVFPNGQVSLIATCQNDWDDDEANDRHLRVSVTDSSVCLSAWETEEEEEGIGLTFFGQNSAIVFLSVKTRNCIASNTLRISTSVDFIGSEPNIEC